MSATDRITTAVTEHGATAVVTVGGEIDLSTAPAFEAAIATALEAQPPVLVVDLSDVTFLASVGLRTLAAAREGLSESVQFAVVADGPATSRPIKMTGLDQMIALYTTITEALTAVAPDATD